MSEREITKVLRGDITGYTLEENLFALADEYECTSNDMMNEMWDIGISDFDDLSTYDIDRTRRYMSER